MGKGATLTITAKGQVTFRRSLLAHLGVRPGDRLAVELLPGGRAELHAAPRGSIDGFINTLARPGERPLSIEDMNEIAARGWAGEQ